MQQKDKSINNKPNHRNHKPINLHTKPAKHDGKSLLQKLTSNRTPVDKQNHQTGKLIIAKLGDFVENKCLYGANCAHLRAQAECHFLHQKKDFEALGVPLPQKYLENQEPLKKSKQERKQDKIKEKAEREKRLKEKQQKVEEKYQERYEQAEQRQQVHPVKAVKPAQQKIMDQKELLIQKIIKPAEGQHLTLGHIHEQLNLAMDAICQDKENVYGQQFNLKELKLTIHEVRKRLLVKFKKNKEFQTIQKLFAEKECALVKKIIKNITMAYKDMVEQVKDNDKWKNIDLRQIQQTFNVDDVNRVLNLKKDNPATIEYYSRFFSEELGYPISFEIPEEEEDNEVNKGNLLPLRKFQLLPIISPNFEFSRLFLSLDISFSEIRSLSEFASLMIPQQISDKTSVQKTFTIDISSVTYSKFVDQIMTEFLTDYHQKMKGPSKEFQFGKIEQNLTKYRTFLTKYKAKITSIHKDNTFILVVYNIKSMIQKIQSLEIEENLDYDKIKKDRSMEEQQTYERLFLLREFINIMGENDATKLRVVYVTPHKKFKARNYKGILGSIDKMLVAGEEKMEAQ